MVNSRKNKKSSFFKNVKKTSQKTLPIVNKGLKTVGVATKDLAKKSIPIVEEGVSAVYGALSTGFDLGVKGVNTVAKGVSKISKKRRSNRHKKSHKTRRHKKK